MRSLLRLLARSFLRLGARIRSRTAAILQRFSPSEAQHLFALTLAVGLICGLVAVGFHLAIRGAERLLIDRAMSLSGWRGIAWTIASPTIGGLLVGFVLARFLPGARGSGIPQVKQAFAVAGGRIRFRDAFGKFWLAVLQIGSGASLGREGPTVQICAGAASLLARLTLLPPKSARRLTAVGVAAGIAAAFNAPIAAVTFTIEEIVGNLDQSILSGVVVAAALAAVIERSILGVHPVIELGRDYGLDHSSSLAFYALLGILAALMAVAFTDGLLRLRAAFAKQSRVPLALRPAVGGLVTGVLAALMIQIFQVGGVTGGGYATLGAALTGKLAFLTVLVLLGVKCLATIFSYSSGGAGGIFAPTLFIGAMLGGSVGYLDVAALAHEPHQLGAFALVGMGAVFAGVVRAPITSVLIIFEMTGSYGLVLPLMLANMTAYMLARRWRPKGIYEALLQQDGVALPEEAARPHALDVLQVADAMTSNLVALASTATVREACARIEGHSFSTVPVLDPDERLIGVVATSALRDAAHSGRLDELVAQLAQKAHTISAHDPLLRAVVRLNDLGTRQLMVLDGTRLVGVLAISDLVRAHARAAPSASDAPGSDHPALATVTADDLRIPCQLVASSTPLATLEGSVQANELRAFVLEGEAPSYHVVLVADLYELARDERMRALLVAADLARPARSVAPSTELTELAELLARDQLEAVVVIDALGGIRGVVPRSAVADALLKRYPS